jgi:hypothetical protein
MGQLSAMAIRWHHYNFAQDRPLDPARLRAAEQVLGVRFPQDYVDCVSQHQGKSPEPANFEFGDGYETALNDLYHFEASPADSNIVESQGALARARVPAGIVAFAGDPAGNPICFDFRASATAPGVVLLDYERAPENAIVPVAASFTELLDKLR